MSDTPITDNAVQFYEEGFNEFFYVDPEVCRNLERQLAFMTNQRNELSRLLLLIEPPIFVGSDEIAAKNE